MVTDVELFRGLVPRWQGCCHVGVRNYALKLEIRLCLTIGVKIMGLDQHFSTEGGDFAPFRPHLLITGNVLFTTIRGIWWV